MLNVVINLGLSLAPPPVTQNALTKIFAPRFVYFYPQLFVREYQQESL
jgi:hypothetical protein